MAAPVLRVNRQFGFGVTPATSVNGAVLIETLAPSEAGSLHRFHSYQNPKTDYRSMS
jgi:hypothetical protein